MKFIIKNKSKLHPYCNKCGWRKGGEIDSWNGKSCKCGLYKLIIKLVEAIDNENFKHMES